ncbi:MAG: homoserine dehydrogenase [Thermodesulfobacteriota bacterium]
MKQINVGLIGFGTVGAGVVRLFEENRDVLDARVGFPLRLRRVVDIDIDTVRTVSVDRSLLTTDARVVLDDPEISIVVELIGGLEPARRYILEAFKNGKHVVTANKALLAHDGAAIFREAQKTGSDVGFEAAVAGGVPILRSLREGLVANRFEKVMGILNGTCNFILSAMDRSPGEPMGRVLKQAQELGYAEADPTLDVNGTDAAHKLVLVLGLTHGIIVPLQDIYIEGITGIDAFDVEMAKEFSYIIKLLAVIKAHGPRVEARLHPTMIPRDHPLAHVDGVFNGIYLKGDKVGELLFRGPGAGSDPTASAVVGDIVEIARNVVHGDSGRVPPLGYPLERIHSEGIVDMQEVITNYYLRVQAMDRPGVLSKISGIMAEHRISLHSVVQKGRHQAHTVPVVFLTHKAREADIQEACRHIRELDVVGGPLVLIRIEDDSLE